MNSDEGKCKSDANIWTESSDINGTLRLGMFIELILKVDFEIYSYAHIVNQRNLISEDK